jgi:hypothetical protein
MGVELCEADMLLKEVSKRVMKTNGVECTSFSSRPLPLFLTSDVLNFSPFTVIDRYPLC